MSMIDDLKRGPLDEVSMSDPASTALGRSAYSSDLRRVNAELETWKAIAIDRGKHLERLMIAIAQVRAELDAFPSRLATEVAERLKANAAEHDRS